MRAAVVVAVVASWFLLAVTATPALAAPTVTLSGPPSPTNDSTPEFTFSSDSSTATFECGVDAEAFAACTSPFTPTTSLGEGPHTFTVRATDATGTGEQPVAFTVDTTAPVVTIDSAPPDPTNSTTASFVFSGTDNFSTPDKLTFQCRLDFRPLEPCSSPKEYTGLSAGQHTVRVRATDEAGNLGTAVVMTWTVDLAPPETTIDSGPPDPTNNPTPEFRFSSDDLSATFECSVDAQGFTPCLSPFTTSSLSDGSHVFEVQAIDVAGNADPTPAIVAFTVATGSPPPVVDSTPPASSSPASPASSDAPVTTSTAPARVATSFVLIAKRTIRVTRRRLAPITLNCAGGKDCAGVVRLTTARPVRTSSAEGGAQLSRKRRSDRDRKRRRRRAIRRVVRLGSARFVIPARTTARVKVRLSKKRYRLVKRLKRVKVMVTVTDRDRAGRVRIGTREVFLTAR